MRALAIVIVDPLVEIALQRFQILINLLAERNAVELVVNGLVEAFADAIQSRRQLHLIATMRVELFG